MGQLVSTKQQRQTPAGLLMVGLDAGGKTTILYRLRLGEVVVTIPTIGFNVETIEHKDFNVICWDVGGRDKIRPLWRHYYADIKAVIFVVDSNDHDRVEDAKEELQRMLGEDELRDACLLVFANKQDLPNAIATDTLRDILGLDNLRYRQWHIQPSCALTGDGLHDGLDWLKFAISSANSRRPGKIITLHATITDRGPLAVSCTNIGGTELAALEFQDPGRQTLGELRVQLVDRIGTTLESMTFVLPDGKVLLASMDSVPLQEALGLQPRHASWFRRWWTAT